MKRPSVRRAAARLPEPVGKLTDFDLTDQYEQPRRYRFPKSKVTVMTIADREGADELAPWIKRLYDRYETRIEIDGVAAVSMIPKFFHNLFREAFRKQITRSVMLDWGGAVVKQFGCAKGVANLYVIDRGGHILRHVTGPVSNAAEAGVTRVIDHILAQ